MHSSDIDFKVHEEIKVGEIIAKIFLAAIEVGEIITKFDISGRIRPTCIFEFTSWQEHLISNMAPQTRVRQSRLAIGSPTPLSDPKIIDEVGRVTS